MLGPGVLYYETENIETLSNSGMLPSGLFGQCALRKLGAVQLQHQGH